MRASGQIRAARAEISDPQGDHRSVREILSAGCEMWDFLGIANDRIALRRVVGIGDPRRMCQRGTDPESRLRSPPMLGKTSGIIIWLAL